MHLAVFGKKTPIGTRRETPILCKCAAKAKEFFRRVSKFIDES